MPHEAEGIESRRLAAGKALNQGAFASRDLPTADDDLIVRKARLRESRGLEEKTAAVHAFFEIAFADRWQ